MSVFPNLEKMLSSERFFLERIERGLVANGDQLTQTDITALSFQLPQDIDPTDASPANQMRVMQEMESLRGIMPQGDEGLAWHRRFVRALQTSFEQEIHAQGQETAALWGRHVQGMTYARGPALVSAVQDWYKLHGYRPLNAVAARSGIGCILPALIVVFLGFMFVLAL